MGDDVQHTERRPRALLAAFHAAFCLLVAPGLPLGLLLLTRQAALPLWAGGAVVGLAAALAWVAWRLSQVAQRTPEPGRSPAARQPGAAIQGAGVPGIPALFALAFCRSRCWPGPLGCWLWLGTCGYGAGCCA
ncbi:hypothetical protein ACFP81_05695 [Deinococcus lacus]|uniref:Uncharacterized protein n=1 Tax=Deinococcus lacus TaxID=392561 RepID=A0ABW1YE90_9DEIO